MPSTYSDFFLINYSVLTMPPFLASKNTYWQKFDRSVATMHGCIWPGLTHRSNPLWFLSCFVSLLETVMPSRAMQQNQCMHVLWLLGDRSTRSMHVQTFFIHWKLRAKLMKQCRGISESLFNFTDHYKHLGQGCMWASRQKKKKRLRSAMQLCHFFYP